jgi:hypothetical protein
VRVPQRRELRAIGAQSLDKLAGPAARLGL